MCGIAGVSLHPNENVNATDLTRALLLGIEERGWHATGVAWADTDGGVWLVKDAVTASEFVKSDHAPADTRPPDEILVSLSREDGSLCRQRRAVREAR